VTADQKQIKLKHGRKRFIKLTGGKALHVAQAYQDTVVDQAFQAIFQNYQITLFPCFTFRPKTGMRLPKTGASFG